MSKKMLLVFLVLGIFSCAACGRQEAAEESVSVEASVQETIAETIAETVVETVEETVEETTFETPEGQQADHVIVFADGSVTLDGEAVKEYDYTWHSDPAGNYEEVKNAPGEYYTGEAPTGEESVYLAHDIFYYPEIPVSDFQKINYDGETEWVTYYKNDVGVKRPLKKRP